ncbi:unnamed protein product [Pseudo-nitzschia multistriata]|uniref:Uncharacterized protein n=1 Tax=Pseudo-nitzschia multistriata TaxID=183589 RepID=A0A448YVH6_9STRA|nr:unnamed protein product [Pseudo-nitzschia multistriata]
MCGPTNRLPPVQDGPAVDARSSSGKPPLPNPATPTTGHQAPPGSSKRSSAVPSGILHVSPAVAAAALAAFVSVAPSYLYVNRGFTVWFHWASLACVLTRSHFLAQALVLCGTSICLGWYACLVHEYAVHGRVFDALHKNMPGALVDRMLLPGGGGGESGGSPNGVLDFESTGSLLAMAVSHVLDFLGHPCLTYYFWRKHRQLQSQSSVGGSNRNNNNNNKTHSNGTNENLVSTASSNTKGDDEALFAWPVILASYGYSRVWSLFHTYHNHGACSWFYVGFDVYVLDDLDAWYVAYAMESLFYVSIVIWKLGKSLASLKTTTTTQIPPSTTKAC